MSYIYTKNFYFENSNGRLYRVQVNVKTGAGNAYLVDDDDTPTIGQTAVELTVQAAEVAALKNRDVSYLCHAAIFNEVAAEGQALDTVLNAA